MNEVNNVGKGLVLIVLTGVALMVMKLGNVISWSWWWVTIPFWGPIALIMIALVVLVALKIFAKLLGWIVKKL